MAEDAEPTDERRYRRVNKFKPETFRTGSNRRAEASSTTGGRSGKRKPRDMARPRKRNGSVGWNRPTSHRSQPPSRTDNLRIRCRSGESGDPAFKLYVRQPALRRSIKGDAFECSGCVLLQQRRFSEKRPPPAEWATIRVRTEDSRRDAWFRGSPHDDREK